jgi:N-acetylmuramoyl-L-alanine amidase
MKVESHVLVSGSEDRIRISESPNISGGIEQKYIVIHYTAGLALKSAEDTFLNRASKVSAHIVIDRDGSVVQMVPFNKRAWHAGVSRWRGLEGMNSYSIGIELVNAGRLTWAGDRWITWTGRTVPSQDAITAVHKHENTPSGWQLYPEAQLLSVIEVCRAIREAYPGILDLVGHDDIAPGRKADPGPAFPMDAVRAGAMGRKGDEEPVRHRTTTRLNLRKGPGPVSSLPSQSRSCRAPSSPCARAARAGVRWTCSTGTETPSQPAGYMATISRP